MLQQDGSIRIAWQADGYEAIVVRGPLPTARGARGLRARGRRRWPSSSARLADLRAALRARFPGAFDLVTDEPAAGRGRSSSPSIRHAAEPNPDPW